MKFVLALPKRSPYVPICICSVYITIKKGSEHISAYAGIVRLVKQALFLKVIFDLSYRHVKYSGESPFFRNRLRNYLVNKKFRQERGIQVGSIAQHADPKSEDKSNPFTPTKINEIVKPDT